MSASGNDPPKPFATLLTTKAFAHRTRELGGYVKGWLATDFVEDEVRFCHVPLQCLKITHHKYKAAPIEFAILAMVRLFVIVAELAIPREAMVSESARSVISNPSLSISPKPLDY